MKSTYVESNSSILSPFMRRGGALYKYPDSGGGNKMPRYTFIHRWKPENTPAVFERFAKQLKGDFPEIIEANKKLNTIAWEFGSVFGQTISIWIVEGEPREISTVLRFWMDLHEIEALPCVGFNIIKQFYPEKHPYYQELSL